MVLGITLFMDIARNPGPVLSLIFKSSNTKKPRIGLVKRVQNDHASVHLGR